MKKDAGVTTQTTTEMSEAEKKVILLMRTLKPFEKIEIKLNDNKVGELAIVVSSNVKEVFPV